MTRACLKRIVAALSAFCVSAAAFAQYVWLDEKGVKQFSDRPPPSSVPAKRILKEPGRSAHSAAQVDTPATEPPAAKDKAPMTLAEKNADFNKRRAEQAENDRKAQEQARLAAEKAKNCERAGEYQRVLESGQRIAATDKSGERYYLSDEQRAREVSENRRYLHDCRS